LDQNQIPITLYPLNHPLHCSTVNCLSHSKKAMPQGSYDPGETDEIQLIQILEFILSAHHGKINFKYLLTAKNETACTCNSAGSDRWFICLTK
jgi:hypothetical protein